MQFATCGLTRLILFKSTSCHVLRSTDAPGGKRHVNISTCKADTFHNFYSVPSNYQKPAELVLNSTTLTCTHHVFINFHGNFKNVTLFCLYQEEEHRLEKKNIFTIMINSIKSTYLQSYYTLNTIFTNQSSMVIIIDKTAINHLKEKGILK